MLEFFIYLCFALLIIVSVLLLLVVLMQRPKQEGLGASFGSQMTDQAFGAQTSNVLKKATVFFGVLFGILCFTLSILVNALFQSQKSDLANPAITMTAEEQKAANEAALLEKVAILDGNAAPAPVVEPAAPAPAPAVEPAAPAPAAAVEPAAPAPAAVVEPAAPAPAAVVEPAAPAPAAVVEPAAPAPAAVVEPAAPAPAAVVEPAPAPAAVVEPAPAPAL